MPSFSLADYAAVTALTRDLNSNPSYVIEDLILDGEGQVTGHLDGKGIQGSAAYDALGRVTRQTVAVGTTVEAKTESDFDAQGNRIRVREPRHFTEPGGFITEFAYNGRNLLASKTEAVGRPEAATESYTYYADGRIADTTDARGSVWTTQWRICCTLVLAKADPLGKVDDSGTNKRGTRVFGTDYANNPTYSAVILDLPVSATAAWWRNPPEDQTLNEVTTTYDARNRPIARTVWLEPLPQSVGNCWLGVQGGDPGTPASFLKTTWRYDQDLTDGVGLDATYSGFLAGLNLGAGSVGSMVEETSPAGRKTLTTMDGLGRVVRTVQVNGDVSTSVVVDMAYDNVADGLVETQAVRYPNGLGGANPITTKVQADGAGRTRKTIDAEDNASLFGFDPNGSLVSARDPNSVGYDATFDERNREQTRVDTQGDRVLWQQFDADSNLVQTKDALDHATVMVFDGRDRKVSVTDRVTGITSFKYDANSNLLEIKDADANARSDAQPTTVYRYDPRNLLILEAYRDDNPEANYSTDESDLNQFDPDDRRAYSYDAARRLYKRVDQTAAATGYAYDMANRLAARQYPDTLNDTFAYDADSRLTLGTSARYSNSVGRSYDSAGRLSAELVTVGGQGYPISYSFDAASRQTGVTYPNGSQVARSFTTRNQLASVSLDGAAVVSPIVYDAGGRETSRTLANGIVQQRSWRTDDLPATIVASGVVNLGYSWDANKRKMAETNNLFAPQTNSYTGYDNEDRLTGWVRGSGDSQTWDLSKVGDWNDTVINGTLQSRTHDPVHELTQVNATPLTYDVKGNLTQNKNAQTYSWDIENRLTQAVVPVGCPDGIAGTHGYAYDALGRRVSKTVGGVTTVFINNADWQEIAEYVAGALPANPIQTYVFGTYIDEPLVMVKAGATRYNYSENALYSVQTLTDSTGAVVERYRFDPYGTVIVLAADGTTVRTASLYGNPWTFTGRRLDSETGLMYFRHRMYDVGLGRFVGRDPNAYVDRERSLYAYVGARPSFRMDPSGLWDEASMTGKNGDPGDQVRKDAIVKRVMKWFSWQLAPHKKFCYYPDWEGMMILVQNRLIEGFRKAAPPVHYDIPPSDPVSGYAQRTLGQNSLHLSEKASDTTVTHELFHIVSDGTEDQDHELTDAVIQFQGGALAALDNYIAGKCQNAAMRDLFVRDAKKIVAGAQASGGLDEKLGFDFDWKKYLETVDKTCCCGQGVSPQKGQSESAGSQ